MKDNVNGKLVGMVVTLAAVLLVPARLAAVQVPLLEYGFNEIGTTAFNSGSLPSGPPSRDLRLANSALTLTDLHSAAGIGVTGMAALGDRAFDNTASAGMSGVGGLGRLDLRAAGLGLAQSLTMMGWFKNVDTGGDRGNIYFNEDGSNDLANRTALIWSPDVGSIGSLRAVIGGTYATTQTDVPYARATNDTWIFFAMTFDGTAASNNKVKFYVADVSTAATLAHTVTANSATTTKNDHVGAIGNNEASYGTDEAFDGMLDNFRLFQSSTDSSGALSLADIEFYRSLDTLVAVPEPNMVMLLGLGGCLLVWRRRARK